MSKKDDSELEDRCHAQSCLAFAERAVVTFKFAGRVAVEPEFGLQQHVSVGTDPGLITAGNAATGLTTGLTADLTMLVVSVALTVKIEFGRNRSKSDILTLFILLNLLIIAVLFRTNFD